MKTKIHFWTWKTEEVKALIEWMRSYYAAKPAPERIYYIGVDTQHITYQPGLIKDYIKTVKPDFLDETRSLLESFSMLTNRSRTQVGQTYHEMSEGRKETLSDSLDYLMQSMTALKMDRISASSEFEYRSIYQMIRNLQQTHQHLYAREKLGNRWLRDQFMAENALWASQLFGNDTKIAVWAHNGHISETKNAYVSMGYHLDKAIGKDYKTIGFSFSNGTFTAVGFDSASNKYTGIDPQAIDTTPVSGSVNHLFHSARVKNFILNLEALEPTSSLSNWLSIKRNLLQIGAAYNGKPEYYYRPTVLTKDFDMIIYIDLTSHSVLVN